MKYVVTWRPFGAEGIYLTIFDGDLELTVTQIMDIAIAAEGIEDTDDDYEIFSIVRADNVDVIY